MESFIFWSLSLLYFLFLFVFIKKGADKVATTQDFSFGTESSSTWAIALSIFATYISSIGFLAIPAKSFATNWIAITVSLNIPLTYWLISRFLMGKLYSIRSPSMYDYLTDRMGPWATKISTLMSLGFLIGRIGIVLHLVALFFSSITHINYYEILIGISIVTTAYSCFGGFKAIIVTDIIQAVFLFSGALLLIGGLLYQLDSSHWQLLMNNPHKMGLGELSFDFSEKTFFAMFLFGLFQHIYVFSASQISIQQYKASSSVEEANRGLRWGLALAFATMAIFTCVGTLLYLFYEQNQLLPKGTAADAVVGHYILNFMNPFSRFFIYISLFSAAMSSLDSAINPSAIIFHESFLKKFSKSFQSELLSLRISSVVTSLLGFLIALAFANEKTIIDAWWEITAFFGLVVTTLMVSALINVRYSLSYFTKAFGGVLLLYLLIKLNGLPIRPEYIGYFGFSIIMAWPLFKSRAGK